jgi:toxin CcdB
MARWDVYRNTTSRAAADIPYLLDVQADLLSHLDTRVVVPLYVAAAVPRPISHLQPVLQVEERAVVMDTPTLVGVPRRVLGERVANLAPQGPTLLAALDFLFTGV